MTRVLVVEDSRTTRRQLVRLFEGAPGFEVVGEAGTWGEATQLLASARPDLVSLDIFLPDGNAPEVVRALMAARPTNIVLVSDTPRGAPEVFEALAAGALELVAKPRPNDEAGRAAFLQMMRWLSKVRARRPRARASRQALDARALKAVCIAASTGGPGALRDLLTELPAGFPAPVVVAQHMAVGFEAGLAQWLSGFTKLAVRVAEDGVALEPGTVLLGPAAKDFVVRANHRIAVRPAPASGYHPSADLLFESMAEVFGAQVVGVVLSGIGSDGAAGVRALHQHGGLSFLQDRDSCAVWGMPAAAGRLGLSTLIDSPTALGQALAKLFLGEAPATWGR